MILSEVNCTAYVRIEALIFKADQKEVDIILQTASAAPIDDNRDDFLLLLESSIIEIAYQSALHVLND